MVLVIFGLLLSLPLVVWGSGLLAKLMNRFRWIVWLGGGVLGYVAGDMILKDPWGIARIGNLLAAIHRIGLLAMAFIVAFLGGWWGRREMTNDEA